MRVAITEADLVSLAPDSVILLTSWGSYSKRTDGFWQRAGGLPLSSRHMASGKPLLVIFDAGRMEQTIRVLEADALCTLQLSGGEALHALAEIDFVNCWRKHHPRVEDSERPPAQPTG